MAYGEKYRFTFLSDAGVEHVIKILQDGYSGTVKHRHLGGAPVLKRQQNGCIHGSSLTFKAEAQADSEFAELYTSDNKEFRVDLFRNNVVVWTGFISTEMYSEPCIAPPYDVELTANDGLGELKMVPYEAQGITNLGTHLRYILNKTGKINDIYILSALTTAMGFPSYFFSRVYINLDYLIGKSCYDALEYILKALRADIFMFGEDWFILRESDYAAISGTISAVVIDRNGGASTTSFSSDTLKMSMGQMYVADMWPIGYLSRAIVPAKYIATTQAPWHIANAILDPDFTTNQQSTHWTKVNCIYLTNVPYLLLGNIESTVWDDWTGSIMQSVSLQRMKTPLKVAIDTFISEGTQEGSSVVVPDIDGLGPGELSIELKLTNNGVVKYGTADGWIDDQSAAFQANKQNLVNYKPKDDETALGDPSATTVTLVVPSADLDDSATLEVKITGRICYIHKVALTNIMGNAGHEEVVRINNGAIGEADTVETFGTVEDTETQLNSPLFLAGVFLVESIEDHSLIGTDEFSDAHSANENYLHVASMAYAVQVALPRLKTIGRLQVPTYMAKLPVFLENNVTFWLQTYEWDLLHDELSIEGISLPSASLSVQAVTVNALDNGYAAGGGTSTGTGSSGGSGSGGGGMIGASKLSDLIDVELASLAGNDVLVYSSQEQRWKNTPLETILADYVTIATTQTITGQKTFSSITYISNSLYVGYGQSNANYANRRLYFGDQSHYIELDEDGYFHFSHGIYSDAFVSAGGLNAGGGGGGGGASSLGELSDVLLNYPDSGDVLYYSSGFWRNTPLSSLLSNYATVASIAACLKYKEWAHGDSSLAGDADNALLGSWLWANNSGTEIDNTPASYGALMSFGGSGNYGPGQIAIASNGMPYFRIRWNGEWTEWNTFVTIQSAQTITGQKTFTSNVILAGSSLLFKSANSATSYGSILIGDGYGQLGIGNAAYMFYPSEGFFFDGGGVPCGASAHRWSDIYSVNGNFSGIVTVNGFNTLDQSNATMSLFNYGARLSKSFNAYGTAFNMRVYDANDNQVNLLYANSYGAGVQSYFVVGDGQTAASRRRLYFGDPNNSKYIELDANGYFHIHGDLYVDGFVSAGGVNANAS